MDLEDSWKLGLPALVPFGALEWHGPHLPLGLDGILAEAFVHRLAAQTGGVILPTTWLSATTLPHKDSLQVPAAAFAASVEGLVEGLFISGARSIALVTGHYAQAQQWILYECAVAAMTRNPDLRVFASTPLEVLEEPALLDHAGRWEAAQLLAVRPDLVDVSHLPNAVTPAQHAVLGEHPATATAPAGEAVLRRALEAWSTWLDVATRQSLFATYEERLEALRGYRDRYFRDSWEQAILAWWADRALERDEFRREVPEEGRLASDS